MIAIHQSGRERELEEDITVLMEYQEELIEEMEVLYELARVVGYYLDGNGSREALEKVMIKLAERDTK